MTDLGQVIRGARVRSGLQANVLAERIGISAPAMSLIESGRRKVKADELVLIANALGMSPLALLEPESPAHNIAVAARATANVEAKASDMMLRLTDLLNIRLALEDVPGASAPAWDELPRVEMSTWLQSARELAVWARARLGEVIEGPGRFAALAAQISNNLSIDVLVERFDDDPVIGGAIVDRVFPTILINARERRQRALFTLAHELGHVLAGDGQNVALDTDLRATSPSERFANAFASELLMPAEEVASIAVQSRQRVRETIGRMIAGFDVSYESAVFRVHNLGLIRAQQRDDLRALGRARFIDALEDSELRARLLAQSDTLGERPVLPIRFLTVLLNAFVEGEVSANPVARVLGTTPEEVIERFGGIRSEPDVGTTDELQQPSIEPQQEEVAAAYDEVPA